MTKTSIVTAVIFTAALAAAVFFMTDRLPSYSEPSDKTVTDDETGLLIEQEGRKVRVSNETGTIWELDEDVLSQDFLFEDVDHDNEKELMILCWKRGRFGEHRPTWVKEDEKTWSQHIFIYERKEDGIIPKWMASDIGMKAKAWEFADGVLSITDTDGNVTRWIWNSWGLEKL